MRVRKGIRLRNFLFLVRFVRSVPIIHRTVWNARQKFHATRRAILVGRGRVAAAPFLEAAIVGKIPYAAGKIGSVEASGVATYLTRIRSKERNAALPDYGSYVSHSLYMNAGVFPQKAEAYDTFALNYLKAISAFDMLVAWDVAGEAEIISRYCKEVTLVSIEGLEPFFSVSPWTAILQGRRVLVISPFSESIKKQYTIHESLWDSSEMLPKFELLTIRTPLSAGLVKPIDVDWFAGMERMKGEMDELDYDVALIGAGAFSIPLAAHAKMRGKVGIHLGGSLQILFGIYGSRWEKKTAI